MRMIKHNYPEPRVMQLKDKPSNEKDPPCVLISEETLKRLFKKRKADVEQ